MKKKDRILYIHGLDGSPNGSTGVAIREFFEDDIVISPKFDNLLDFGKTFDQIRSILNTEDINIIVGHSLGAFYTLALNTDEASKIIINPCMFPSLEIPTLVDVDSQWIQEMTDIENRIYEEANSLIRQTTFAIFGKNDNLFSYKDTFNSLYRATGIKGLINSIIVPGEHRVPASSLERGLENAIYYANTLDEMLHFDEVKIKLDEHFLNIDTHSTNSNIAKYKDSIFELLQKAYEPVGGILGLEKADDLVNDSDLWKIDRKNDHIYAVAIYTKKRKGRKLQYVVSDGTQEGKDKLFRILKDDITLIDRQAWAEVSGKMEHLHLKQGATKLPIEAVKALLPDKKILELTEDDIKNYKGKNDVADGFHYKRKIGRSEEIKLAVTNISNQVS